MSVLWTGNGLTRHWPVLIRSVQFLSYNLLSQLAAGCQGGNSVGGPAATSCETAAASPSPDAGGARMPVGPGLGLLYLSIFCLSPPGHRLFLNVRNFVSNSVWKVLDLILSIQKTRLETAIKTITYEFWYRENDLLIRRPQVRILPGAPIFSSTYAFHQYSCK